MARNIFNQPAKDNTTTASPAPPETSKLPGSVGGLRESLREITANSIRDIEPERIDMDSLNDRLALDDSGIEDLAESIRKHGQQVPIMVRPSEQASRYRVVYGRRRLAAIRKIGGPVKAIVRTLDDDASLIAQGQENSLRLDPSFIEKALFIQDMQKAGYKPGVIQDALGLTRQGVSNHRVIIDRLPHDLIRLVGPAHGVGRRQWSDLAAFSDKLDLLKIAKDALGALPDDAPSPEKFQLVYTACSRQAREAATQTTHGRTIEIKGDDGSPFCSIAISKQSISVRFAHKSSPEFNQWLDERAEEKFKKLFGQWRNKKDSAS